MQRAPLIGTGRHRLAIDGQGVTTLVAFHGCPLRCKYCLNDACWRPEGIWREVTTAELLDDVRIDNLYFLATGGGITFGGGEPCLRSLFIEEFHQMMDQRWHLNIETSLCVDHDHVERLLPLVDQWIIDIKDCSSDIYKRYTGKHLETPLTNLRWLLSHDGMAEKIIVRLPLIPDYNTKDDIRRSRKLLTEMGVTHFDEFKYIIKK